MSPPPDAGQPPFIPPPPSLVSDDPAEERTNTAALLLPHLSLFAPPILQILRQHYENYGLIAHWAPVKAFGRVIIVWQEVEGCEQAKRHGDFLKLDVDLPSPEESHEQSHREELQGSGGDIIAGEGYFKPKTKRQKPTILRLYPLPFTPINPDPASFHLAPPEHEKNFLISPPGSPPEGWEPIVEDGPNTITLAEDLQRALESLALNGIKRGRRGSKEVILEEGGVRVEVEDTTMQEDQAEEGGESGVEGDREDKWGVEERIDARAGGGVWEMPGSRGSTSALGTPMARMKMIPTAMPPR